MGRARIFEIKNQSGITWKPFLRTTHRLDLIHIPIKFHEDKIILKAMSEVKVTARVTPKWYATLRYPHQMLNSFLK